MKSILNTPVVYLWRKMYFYAEDRRKYITWATILFIFANVAEAIQPLVFAKFLDFIQISGITRENLPSILLILFLFLLLEIIFWVFWAPARIIEQRTAFQTKKNYKEYLLRGTMALPLAWHTDRHSGDTIDKIEKGSGAMFSFSEHTFLFIQAAIRLVISIGALTYFSLYASITVILISAFTFYIMIRYDRKLIPGYKIVNKIENGISAKVYDVISNITTVIILRIESLVFKSLRKSMEKPFGQFNKNINANEWKWIWASILGQISVVTTLIIYIYLNLSRGNIVLIGAVFILYSYSSRVRETFFSFAHLYNDSVKWRTNVANAEEISKDFSGLALLENRHLPKAWSSISIKDLSFSYHTEDDADLHLDDIDVEFKKGEKIALIGESGGGKTTFLKLLRGLYFPKTILLQVDQKQIPDLNLISDSISLIPQDPEIFSTTIRENITLGVDHEDEEIKVFTDMASFTEVVARLPKGLESSIVEKGVNLSGGEKQRLALSRGLLASIDKEIVLLDEPTSSVDFHNELKIYENIFSYMPDKTVISSIHRLHLLSLFDNIFFFKDGRIVARGNLAYLKENSKDFQKLWNKYLKTQNQ